LAAHIVVHHRLKNLSKACHGFRPGGTVSGPHPITLGI
jgi:uncharacterized protein VirK/YbjX